MSAPRLRHFAAVLLLSLSGPAALAADAPAVLRFSPQGELETVRQVTARFATDMVRLGDPAVRNPFTVQCGVKGRGRWVDARNWAYDFERDVPRGYSCAFTLVQGQRDAQGAELGGPRRFAFNTSPIAEAPAAAPAGQAVIDFFVPQGEAYPVRQVQVRFSEDMVRLGGGGLMNPFGIGCAVKGKGRWVDTRNWVYDFEADLPSGIACQFVPVAGLRALSGKPLKPYSPLRFTTGGPHVTDVRPYENSETIDENQVFLLKFDGENDRASLANASHCLVENIKERVPLRYLTGEDTRAFVAKLPEEFQRWWSRRDRTREWRAASCARQLPPGAKVQLVFARGLLSATGVARSTDQVLRYKVRPSFTATFTCTRENARQSCAPMTDMRLDFTDVVPAAQLQAIRLEGGGKVYAASPKAYEGEYEGGEGEVPQGMGDADGVVFHGPFPAEADFVLRLPADLRDQSGRPLLNAARFPLAVRTAAYPPLAKFAADFGIIEKAAGAVPLTVRNLEPADGLATAARLYTLKLPDSDTALLQWLGRFRQHQRVHDCYQCARRDDNGRLLEPDPRSRSLLLREPGAVAQPLPRQLGAKEFEVIGLPVQGGAYIHEVESRYLGASLIENQAPMYVAALSIVTNLGVHLRKGHDESLVWVTSMDKAQPVAGAEVKVYQCRAATPVWQGRTDAQGIARFPTPADFSGYDDACMSRYAVIARANGDRGLVLPGWDEGIENWRFNLSGWRNSGDYVAHTILDRSLLRAGETVHMRHVVRELALRALVAPRKARFKRLYLVHEGSGQEYELPLAIGPDGNGENQWAVPRAAKLGRYQVMLEIGDRGYELGQFQVAEFRLPVLKAQLQLPGGPQVAPARLPVDMQLNYLNGGAYSGAPVTLRGRLAPVWQAFPDYEGYSFADIREYEGGEDDGYGIALEEQALKLDGNGG
ncbi:MAG TPA: MG2 domain-containing protein, partial [Moraxellaceae bacterium]|nr:MG2 domain-containing protein [Moraxellaceae bacterium]